MNLRALLEAIVVDFAKFNRNVSEAAALEIFQKSLQDEVFDFDDVNEARIYKFAKSLSVNKGRKYIKVISGSGVWGFIMNEDDAKFRRGDILKAAGWNTPARNSARGNVISGDLSWVNWTGPAYL